MQWTAVSQHRLCCNWFGQRRRKRWVGSKANSWPGGQTRATCLQLLLPDLFIQHSPDVHHGPGAEADGPRQAGHLWGREAGMLWLWRQPRQGSRWAGCLLTAGGTET